MKTRRTEPFRYTMKPPMDCWIEITSINDMPVTSKLAEAELIDISKSGCRIRTPLDLHSADHTIGAAMHIQLSDEKYTFPGHVRWQKALGDGLFHYGLSLMLTKDEKERFNIELRTLAAARRIVVF